tara:strand:+ start:1951 stop:2160 length:210 start_codon:yes stop_codon:yes gene_type:complete
MPNLGLPDFFESLKGQGKQLLLDTKHNSELAKSVALEKPITRFAFRLGTGICTVWNDNPKAFKWWWEMV